MEYVWPYFEWMREYYADACEAGDAMLSRLG